MAKPAAGGRRPRKKERKNVPHGIAYVQASFNNTIVTITDGEGRTLSWKSAGSPACFFGDIVTREFRRGSTPFAVPNLRDGMVRMIGLEPTLPRGNWNLNPARLPVSPHPQLRAARSAAAH